MDRPTAAFVLLAATLLAPSGAVLGADGRYAEICGLVMREEQIEREDLELEVELAREAVEAFGQIFALLDGLWKADAIERMNYLRGKYDYEAAKLGLEQAELVVAREKALERQIRLVCGEESAGASPAGRVRAIEAASLDYLRAECGQRAKAIEVARVNLEFQRQLLESVLDLRRGEVATKQDVIRAELEVAREERRLADAERRTEECRRELGAAAAEPDGESTPGPGGS